ncbi:MAG: Holliday junction resolvase RuvX [Magnetovibrionaceae bacterium]
MTKSPTPTAIVSLEDLKAGLGRDQRLMGLDPGTKTIGIALADVLGMVAGPLETIKRRKFSADVERLKTLIKEHDVGGLVVGLPVSLDGTEGPRAQSVRDFTRNCCQATGLKAAFWDERLSTAAVERILIGEADLTRKRRSDVVDRAAAAYILQGALDYLAGRA